MKIAPRNPKIGCQTCAKSLDENISASLSINPNSGLKKSGTSKVISIINTKRSNNSKVKGLF